MRDAVETRLSVAGNSSPYAFVGSTAEFAARLHRQLGSEPEGSPQASCAVASLYDIIWRWISASGFCAAAGRIVCCNLRDSMESYVYR